MGKLFYIIGQSATGKDHIGASLLRNEDLGLISFVLYTTRPIRSGEREGVQYHFTDRAGFEALKSAGRVIEERTYQTVKGPWTYFTVDPGVAEGSDNYLGIGTVEAYRHLHDYYGDLVIPLFISVTEENRLLRAMKRERKEANPNYREMCRRFLADCEDFSEEKIEEAGITRRFDNNGAVEDCVAEITEYIKERI